MEMEEILRTENKQKGILGDALTLSTPMDNVEQVLEQYLAIDGEQKVYVLPDDLDVEKLLSNLTGAKTGEVTQSQMWRKTEVKLENKEQSKMIATMDQRIKRLEFLLQQSTEQDNEALDKKND